VAGVARVDDIVRLDDITSGAELSLPACGEGGKQSEPGED